MKERSDGFLNIAEQHPEVFSYIQELHEYLWQFCRVVKPGVSGSLRDCLDSCLKQAQQRGLHDRRAKGETHQ